jgi:hypothetical protein
MNIGSFSTNFYTFITYISFLERLTSIRQIRLGRFRSEAVICYGGMKWYKNTCVVVVVCDAFGMLC